MLLGCSVTSRSFVQQNDESGQQKNSYEVAEKISIKSTICKVRLSLHLPNKGGSVDFYNMFRESEPKVLGSAEPVTSIVHPVTTKQASEIVRGLACPDSFTLLLFHHFRR